MIGRWLLFAGTLTWVGAAAVRWVLLPLWSRGSGGLGSAGHALSRAAAIVGLFGSLCLLAGVTSRLQTQVADFVDPFDPAGPQVRLLLSSTLWGKVWISQAVITMVGTVAFVTILAGRERPWWGIAGVVVFP